MKTKKNLLSETVSNRICRLYDTNNFAFLLFFCISHTMVEKLNFDFEYFKLKRKIYIL